MTTINPSPTLFDVLILANTAIRANQPDDKFEDLVFDNNDVKHASHNAHRMGTLSTHDSRRLYKRFVEWLDSRPTVSRGDVDGWERTVVQFKQSA